MTGFERLVLGRIARGAFISGAGMVAYVAAARRLEQKGLATKGVRWYLTDLGRTALALPDKAVQADNQAGAAMGEGAGQ